jgi:hypothetical protein
VDLAVFSPDRKFLLVPGHVTGGSPLKNPDVVLHLLDANTGRAIRTLRGPVTGPSPAR